MRLTIVVNIVFLRGKISCDYLKHGKKEYVLLSFLHSLASSLLSLVTEGAWKEFNPKISK